MLRLITSKHISQQHQWQKSSQQCVPIQRWIYGDLIKGLGIANYGNARRNKARLLSAFPPKSL